MDDETLDWLGNPAAGTYNVRDLGAFDGVKVLEYAPHARAHIVTTATLIGNRRHER
jgi:hypothetical protein